MSLLQDSCLRNLIRIYHSKAAIFLDRGKIEKTLESINALLIINYIMLNAFLFCMLTFYRLYL